MRILVLTTSYPRFPGDGTAPFVQSICEHLVLLGHQVHVVAPYDPALGATTEKAPVRRFRYTLLGRWHIMGHAKALAGDMQFRPAVYALLPLFLVCQFLAGWREARRMRAEIIYAHWVLPSGLVGACLARLLHIPLAISLHGSDVFVARRSRWLGLAARLAFRSARVITACSPELHEGALRLGAPRDRVHLVPWGADPERFSPAVAPLDRARFGLAATGPVLVALGRLVPKKGFDVLVEALPHVLQGHPQAQLVIGGTGPQAGELQQRARNLGVEARLHLPGTISWQDVPGFLAMADVFVLPSVRDRAGNTDGLPTVLLEALALGKPVVATEIAGVPLVVRSGANGLLCPPGDARALGSALSELLSDPDCRRRLGQAGRAAVEERFNWLAVARTLSGLFEGPAAQPARLRLGTQYRLACFREAGIEFRGERVLEVGAHDGSILATAHGKVRVGVDLEPAACPPGCHMVRADGNRLPFRSAAFDEVIAADVIEHVPDEQEFLAELQRATAAGGRLFLTTPSSHIRLFPNFLTGYISRSWGHVLRRGFAAPALQALAGPDAAVRDWSAPAYRLSYLPLRFLAPLFPGLAARAVRRTARYDAAHSQGQRGFYWLSWRKPHGQEAAN